MEWEYVNIFVLIPLGFVYHARTFIPRPSINVVYNDNSPNSSSQVHKDSPTLTYPPNMNIGLVLQYGYPCVSSLKPRLMLIIDTHASTYIPYQHRSPTNKFARFYLHSFYGPGPWCTPAPRDVLEPSFLNPNPSGNPTLGVF